MRDAGFWSAALFRRFFSFPADARRRKKRKRRKSAALQNKKSGGKAPHSKKGHHPRISGALGEGAPGTLHFLLPSPAQQGMKLKVVDTFLHLRKGPIRVAKRCGGRRDRCGR